MFTDPILLAFAACMAFIGTTLTAWFWPKDTPSLPPPTEKKDAPPQAAPSEPLAPAPQVVQAPAPGTAPSAAPQPPSVAWAQRLSQGLGKTRQRMQQQWAGFFTSAQEKQTRDALLETVLETLIGADVGVATADALVALLKDSLPTPLTLEALTQALQCEVVTLLEKTHRPWNPVPPGDPQVILMVGVNGVGKTTTAGKLAAKGVQKGQMVVLGAADTYRAAAVDQLATWAQRSGATLIQMPPGADPASVAYESVKKTREMGAQLCVVDTAGRLHNHAGLMDELSKIKRVLGKGVAGAPHEVLLVLDATTGQNAINQAKIFGSAAGVTGLVLTKLDGTAKGGVALAISRELGLPIRYVGVGESLEDLQEFNPREFAQALFS